MKIIYSFIFSFLTLILNISAYAEKYVIISDVDDTIKITAVMAGTKLFAENSMQSNAFFAMPLLFKNFSDNNTTSAREIFYVTGAKGPLAYPANHFLQVNKFPTQTSLPSQANSNKLNIQNSIHGVVGIIEKIPSVIHNHNHNVPQEEIDPYFPVGTGSSYLNHKINDMILNGKVAAIKKIMDSDPEIYAILMGDNGQLDPDVYLKISSMYPNRTVTFMHHIYAGPDKNIINYSTSDSRKRYEIYKNQIPYFTTADLAIQFYKMGFISRDNVTEILDQSIKALDHTLVTNSKEAEELENTQKLFYAPWMHGCSGFLNTSEWERIVLNQLNNDDELLDKITKIHSEIVSYPGCKAGGN
ncbi:DUF2183 domain-containing protein [Pigmentibacter sp. JX0631]|uniref:phosphatase domain-containing protein n=1 Tax=Pigmentibacter sp. JX0631 TaxID=2976982 RepID=UPI002469232A|nr:phosphatase domain-containing protein [Pigmentibacter sp. JX0631]WGL61138.1 DUF2183 domain-containing protein [Pigmentibacter sp. JX0631]